MKLVILVFTLLMGLSAMAAESKKDTTRTPASTTTINATLVASGGETVVYTFSKILDGVTYTCFFTSSVYNSDHPGSVSCYKK